MPAHALSDIEKRFLEIVSYLGGEGDSCDRNARYAIEVMYAYLCFNLFGVEIADVCKCIGEAWDYPQVNVVGACFSACEFEDSEFEGVYSC